MSIIRHISIFFLLLFLIAQPTINFSYANRDSEELCIEEEKKALIIFKQDLYDPANKLSSWAAEKGCCEWAGIICNNITGHVMELHLGNTQDFLSSLSGKINPSLLSLKHLTHLNLSHNVLSEIQSLSFLGSFISLRYLDLIYTWLSGMIPYQLGNLSSLRYLGLGDNFLSARNLSWIFGLYSLEYLDMSRVNLSEAYDWLLAINKLPSLSELHLSSCGLNHIHPLSYVNFTSLSVLDISSNSFRTSLPNWLFNLSSLVTLDLSQNYFEGPLPCFPWSTKSIRSLDVSENNLNSTIPSCLYGLANLENLNLRFNEFHGVISSAIENLTFLVSVDLAYNALEGKIPVVVRNLCNLEEISLRRNKYDGKVLQALNSLSGCVSNHLKSLDLSQNMFFGEMTDQILNLKNLEYLSLRYNRISGSIPASLGRLSKLTSLKLDITKLSGSLPSTLDSLSNLEELYIYDNLLEGVVSEVHFANLTNLKIFSASGNSLTLRVNPHWIPPFLLTDLDLSSWKLGPRFPLWLKSQEQIGLMDLSNTGISETIPSWFSNLSCSRIYLGSNKLKGTLPRISSTIEALDLSNKSFTGGISHFLCHSTGRVPSSLTRGNLLSGNIPDCWKYWLSLELIDLSNNNLTGPISSSIGSLSKLELLYLRNNSLSGEIPSNLQNCTSLTLIDLGLNNLVGSIPKWIGTSLSSLKIFGLRSNKLSNRIPKELCLLTKLQILDAADNTLYGTLPTCFNNLKAMATKQESLMSVYSYDFMKSAILVTKGRQDQYDSHLYLVTSLDLSSNNLSGKIPEQLTSLQGLFSLNLSGNHLRGNIPDEIGNMIWLETLDVSRNHLSGKIPPSISNLNFLTHLNLSNNNLSGEIPTSTQIQSMDASTFIGNQLCGPPLTKKCRAGNKKGGGMQNKEEDSGEGDEHWFHLGIATGFAVGFAGVICPLIFYGAWRRAYFWFVEYMMDNLSDYCFTFKYMLINKFLRSNN